MRNKYFTNTMVRYNSTEHGKCSDPIKPGNGRSIFSQKLCVSRVTAFYCHTFYENKKHIYIWQELNRYTFVSMANDYTDKLPPVKLPPWLSEKWATVIWIGSFGILMLLSFFIFIPVAITMSDTNGNCLLYAGSRGFGNLSVCSYCVSIGVICLCIYALRLALQIVKLTQFSSKIASVSMWFSIWGVHIVVYVLDLVLAIILLVSSCMLSAGLSMMCQDLFHKRELCSSKYGVELPNGDVNTTFYKHLTMAEVAAWITCLYWLILVVVESLILWKNETFVNIANQVRSFVPRK